MLASDLWLLRAWGDVNPKGDAPVNLIEREGYTRAGQGPVGGGFGLAVCAGLARLAGARVCSVVSAKGLVA